jgi:ATP-binding cassette subfamily B protein
MALFKKFIENVSLIKRGVKMLFQIEKTYMILLILTSVISVIPNYINIYFMAKIVDELVEGKNINRIILYVLVTLIGNFVLSLLIGGLTQLRGYRHNQFFKNEQMFLADKLLSMDYSDIENRETKMLFEQIKAESRSGYNTFYLYTYFGSLITSVSNIIASFLLTFNLFFAADISIAGKLLSVAFIILTICINFYTTKKQNEYNYIMLAKNVISNAFSNFYDGFYSDYNAGKDVRIYQMENFAAAEHQKQCEYSYNLIMENRKKTLPFILTNSICNDVLNLVIYLFIIRACVAGSVTIGSIAKYITGITLFINATKGLISQTQSLFNNNKYLVRYFSFLDIPSKMSQGERHLYFLPNKDHILEFRNVSFKYSGSNAYAVKNLNLKINFGEKTAIVGLNGSGKTTFVKLLCRLYDPTEGEILLDGVNIKNYRYEEYKALFSIIFQDFKLFAYPLAQNIACSMSYSAERVHECLDKAGFGNRLAAMNNGIETCLYKDFDRDGVEISGGEAQKIAFARSLYKDAPILIFDEPTAALDPIAEYEFYLHLNDTVGDKMAIYIAHRMDSCRFCDHIIVFNDGEIVQKGNHESLLRDESGKYFELWNAQAQYYV